MLSVPWQAHTSSHPADKSHSPSVGSESRTLPLVSGAILLLLLQVSADSLLKTEQIPSAQRHSEAKEQLQACGQFSPAASGREPSESLKESLENFVNGVPQKQASQHQTDRPAAAEMLPLQEGRKANLGLPQPKCADAEMLAVDTPGQVTVEESDAQAKLVVHSHTEPITKSGSGKLDSADQGNQRGPYGQETKKPASRHKQDSLRMRSRPDTDQGNDRADTKHLAPAQPMAESEAAAERPVKSSNKPTTLERRSESPSSSSTTSVSSGSDSEGEHSRCALTSSTQGSLTPAFVSSSIS